MLEANLQSSEICWEENEATREREKNLFSAKKLGKVSQRVNLNNIDVFSISTVAHENSLYHHWFILEQGTILYDLLELKVVAKGEEKSNASSVNL